MTTGQQRKMTNIMALDTTCSSMAACIIVGDTIHYAGSDAGRPRSNDLAAQLADLLNGTGLQWQDIDAYAFGCGPGSFTGLRIGAATLAGFNSGRNRPFLHISSLAITAWQADTSAEVTVLEDARAGEAFMACYRNGEAIIADCCLPWQEVASMPAASFVSQSEPAIDLSGWQRLPLQRSREQALALAVEHTLASTGDWESLPVYPRPAYLQLSQAERNRKTTAEMEGNTDD